jgi:hypothetical protein
MKRKSAKKRHNPRRSPRRHAAASPRLFAARNPSLLDVFEQTTGIIGYPTNQTSTLRETDGRLSLLVLDVPPLGLFDISDVAAAADHFRNLLNVPPGATITVAGERGVLNGQGIFKVVRTQESNRLVGGRG